MGLHNQHLVWAAAGGVAADARAFGTVWAGRGHAGQWGHTVSLSEPSLDAGLWSSSSLSVCSSWVSGVLSVSEALLLLVVSWGSCCFLAVSSVADMVSGVERAPRGPRCRGFGEQSRGQAGDGLLDRGGAGGRVGVLKHRVVCPWNLTDGGEWGNGNETRRTCGSWVRGFVARRSGRETNAIVLWWGSELQRVTVESINQWMLFLCVEWKSRQVGGRGSRGQKDGNGTGNGQKRTRTKAVSPSTMRPPTGVQGVRQGSAGSSGRLGWGVALSGIGLRIAHLGH